MRLTFDIGGTFTDFVLFDERSGDAKIWKIPTSRVAPGKAVIEEIAARVEAGEMEPSSVTAVLHATTIATNAVLERKGEATALITTRGFQDVFLIGRQKRYEINNLHLRKPKPLIRRSDVYEVSERMSADGDVVEPLNEREVRRLAEELASKNYVAVAVVLLHAYANSAHERRIEEILRAAAPHLELSISSKVSPKIREYERTSTTIADAYVKPIVKQYLGSLESSLSRSGIATSLSIMQSNGGLVSTDLACDYPIRIVESGPAAGVQMCVDVGRQEGLPHLITFDMGGTTAKLGAVDDGRAAIMPSFEVDTVSHAKGSGLPLNITSVELLEIGAGGGSIAAVESGLISVGPQSAGADPGPICYGNGGIHPTVTDANLVLGYLNPKFFNGGTMQLDLAGAAEGIERFIGRPLGLGLQRAAWGIHRIANINMERATRVVSMDRGRDPRRYAMVAFGGAGPLHAVRLAKAIGIPLVVVPRGAGVGSALGLLCAEHKLDWSVTRLLKVNDTNIIQIGELFQTLEEHVVREARRLNAGGEFRIQRSGWMRYHGQGFEIRVDFPHAPVDHEYITKLKLAFHEAYKRAYGYVEADIDIEGTEWYVVAKFESEEIKLSFKADASGDASIVGQREAYFPEADGCIRCSVLDRYQMARGRKYEGPALIEERESTTVIGPGDSATISEAGHMLIQVGQL